MPEQQVIPHHETVRMAPEAPTLALISGVALHGVGLSAEQFHVADNHFIGVTPEGEHRLLVGRQDADGRTTNEAVGSGRSAEQALLDSLDHMRSLETVATKPVAEIKMTETATVRFTTLEHYNPRVAPSHETYPVPDTLEAMLQGSEEGNQTYRNTVAREGWQTELRDSLADYLAHDAAGEALARSLKIRSLSHLTPEQAVKLSTAYVQNVSKYSYTDVGAKGPTGADQATSMELLADGKQNRTNPEWGGNGVCRNVSSNVKAVFEAIKATQAELSMLNNTYCVYGSGVEGDGYADSRGDASVTKMSASGHAWNTFVTISSEGSATATSADATWALGRDTTETLSHLDRTESRAAAQMVKLFERSEVKLTAFENLATYLDTVARRSVRDQRLAPDARVAIQQYATTSYLRAAAQLTELPHDSSIPPSLMSGAYQLRTRLENHEIATLYALDKASGSLERDRIKMIVRDYDAKHEMPLRTSDRADNVVFADDGLQALAVEAVGVQRIVQLSDNSGKLRARVRELYPELLPSFDPGANLADAAELSYFAEQCNIHDKSPAKIMAAITRKLQLLTRGNQAIYAAITVGRSDYDLAKNFKAISAALAATPARE